MQKRITHSRRIKTIFVFLAAMILVSHLSSVLMLNGVISAEKDKIEKRLRGVASGVLQLWTAGGFSLEGLDSLVTPLVSSGLVAAMWVAENKSEGRWRINRFGQPAALASILGDRTGPGATTDHQTAAPFSNSELTLGKLRYRSISLAGTVNGRPVIVGVAGPMPTVARLQAVRYWDLLLRGVILVLFVWFGIQFLHSIFLPYQKMRVQAERLSETGLLPGPRSDDVEYVMETFAAAVTRLTKQNENLQQKFKHSKLQYETLEKFNTYILNSMSAGVLILNKWGKVLRVNPSAQQILGLQQSQIIDHSYHQLARRFPELGAVLTAGLEDSQAYVRREITVKLDGDSGDDRYLGITTSLIHDEEDQVRGISVLLTDLTEIKRLQADLENNRRLADLGEMAGGLAHQLRNSMAAILGFGRLLQRKLAPDDPAADTVGDFLREAVESEQMLARFLNFARPLDLVGQSCSLVGIIESAAETVKANQDNRQLEVVIQQPPGDDAIDVDPVLLRQVFVNLFANAAEAMSGETRVDVRLLPPVNPADPHAHWLVRVGDNGPGIPGGDHERIFQPFFTSKENGTGLGLPIARKIVLCHGGYLSVESSTPQGTVFLLRLPPDAKTASVFHQDRPPATRMTT